MACRFAAAVLPATYLIGTTSRVLLTADYGLLTKKLSR